MASTSTNGNVADTGRTRSRDGGDGGGSSVDDIKSLNYELREHLTRLRSQLEQQKGSVKSVPLAKGTSSVNRFYTELYVFFQNWILRAGSTKQQKFGVDLLMCPFWSSAISFVVVCIGYCCRSHQRTV